MIAHSNGLPEEIPASPELMERAYACYSAMTLNVEDRFKSKAKIIPWRGRVWTCTGAASHNHRLLKVDLHEVVPEERYRGEPNQKGSHGPAYYAGVRFTCDRLWWVMTGYEIALVPDPSFAAATHPSRRPPSRR
jgi:hypothetical protein